jgi:hypothetical protein
MPFIAPNDTTRRLPLALALVACLAATGACSRATSRATAAPAPAPDSPTRGSEETAAAVEAADQVAIYHVLLTRFYRPAGGQARWIDPHPLAETRDPAADSVVATDPDWADQIRESTSGLRLCILALEEDECRNRPGGILRFSHVYANGPDSATVFARYTPARDTGTGVERAPGVVMELVFAMRRRGDSWHIAHQRPVR